VKRKLHELAHARPEQGDTLTLALIAYREKIASCC
jgi:hypothetical protein